MLKTHIKNTITKFIKENINAQSLYFSNINMSTEDVFDLIQWEDTYKNLFPYYSDYENEYEDEYYFESKNDAFADVNQTLDIFNSLPDPIPIYRTIKVKSINDIDLDNLGESWSFDKDSAINFANNEGRGNYLLIAKTNFNNVDWEKTIELYYQFSKGNDSYDENEIYVMDNDNIFDLEIQKL